MTEKKELNKEELEKVAGGEGFQEDTHCIRTEVGKHIDKYEASNYIGKIVAIVDDDHAGRWGIGRLLDSFEKTNGCGSGTTRVHKIDIIDHANWDNPIDYDGQRVYSCGVYLFNGDDNTLYETFLN